MNGIAVDVFPGEGVKQYLAGVVVANRANHCH
jgi:hypothetical protein